MEKYNCIIVDDDEIVRLTMVSYIEQFPKFAIVGVFEDATSILSIINQMQIDVLFLDIVMAGLNGIEFRRNIIQIPVCVFITSHPEYAIESFEVNTFDYILKPIKLERLKQTIERIEELLAIKEKAKLYEAIIKNDTVIIKEGREQTKINIQDIIYLEAFQNYTKIVTFEKRHYVLSNLGLLLKDNHFKAFIRIHKSFAVQKQFVKKTSSQEVILNNGLILPLGRNFKSNLNLIL